VVLDASAEINELMKLDASIGIYPYSSVKDFKNVTLNIVNEHASRTRFKKDKENVTRAVNIVKEYICDKRIDEDILIYGLKEKGFQYQDNLKHALSKVIPEERIFFVTHGNERGINEFRDIKHIVIIGVPYLSERVLQAQIIGQMDDIYFNVTPELANKISHSSIADHFYQAIGRGNCRNIENGQAGEMTILMFLPKRDRKVIEYLLKVMKHLTVVEWRSQYQTENSRDGMEKWLRLAFKYLDQDKPEDFTSGKLKRVIGSKLDSNSNGWRRFIKLFEQKVREQYIKDRSTFRRLVERD